MKVNHLEATTLMYERQRVTVEASDRLKIRHDRCGQTACSRLTGPNANTQHPRLSVRIGPVSLTPTVLDAWTAWCSNQMIGDSEGVRNV